MGEDPLEAVKRKVYLAAIVFGLPAVLLLWVAFEPADSVARVVVLLFALLCLAAVWALWSRPVSVRLVERASS